MFKPWACSKGGFIVEQIESLQARDPRAAELDKLASRREELLEFRGGRFRELMLHGLEWLKREKQRRGENPPVAFVFAVSEGTPSAIRKRRLSYAA